MPNCMEQVYSEEYYDFLIPYGVEAEVPSTPGCVQRIAEDYDIFFYPREGLPPLSIGNYTYTAIPKCYALLDTPALDHPAAESAGACTERRGGSGGRH